MNTDKHGYKTRFLISNFKFQIKKISVSIRVYLWIIILFAFPDNAAAQIRPVYDQGALGLGQLLKRLNTTASVMMIGAHPDDEDTALLAYLARGESARTAYLSLTRGDGGQNIIGPELGESLGVIRTEELLQARRLDGAEQYFTRAYDYGFSKTLDEAKRKWDEKIILCDVVRVIRHFRPLVVVSQFSGTPADGHGHHQYAGYISPLAVKAAANSAVCQDAGTRWEVQKFYVRHRGAGEPTLRINTGKYDPLLGRSYFEIAMEARSQHKSQEQGVLELKGDQFSSLNLVGSDAKETGIFDGLDVSIKHFGPAVSQNIESALDKYDPNNSYEIIPFLSKDQKDKYLQEAIKLAAGIRVDALAGRETIVPGEELLATVKVFFPNADKIKITEILLRDCYGCTISKIEEPTDINAPTFRRENANETAYFKIIIGKDAKPTQPYWLESKRQDSLFNWQNDQNQTFPFQPPLAIAEVKVDVGGKNIQISQPVEYRFADDTRGEIRREINVVPSVSLGLESNLMIVPTLAAARKQRIVMTVRNNTRREISGSAKFDAPLGWKLIPESAGFSFRQMGDKAALSFELHIPAGAKIGTHKLSAIASVEGIAFDQQMQEIAYTHIQTHRIYTKADVTAEVLDLRTAPVKVGYIMGSGDRVPDAIRRMGIDVTMLGEKDLSTGDLSKFDTIVVGIRASQVRPDFVANNGRLLDFVKNGGTMVVQYQQQEYVRQNLMPFPAKMTTNIRVVDENAPVKILEPEHPIFNFPNKIAANDWKNWVQERNLYTITEFDAKYTPLLESHDPGEPENKGGLLVADVGKGKYVYCSYSMFRQLPAGVPGAYRLFANLLSLPRVKK